MTSNSLWTALLYEAIENDRKFDPASLCPLGRWQRFAADSAPPSIAPRGYLNAARRSVSLRIGLIVIDSLHIDAVILVMGAHKLHPRNACAVLHFNHQTVFVAADVEYGAILSAVPLFKIPHEYDQRVHCGFRHGVINTHSHAANRAEAIQIQEAMLRRF